MIRDERAQLTVYTYCHFAMDFLCCSLLVAKSPSPFWWLAGYHGLAFAMQPVFGILTDRYPKLPYGIFSALLIIAAYAIQGISVPCAVAAAGIGNALFHLEGGYVSLHQSRKKIADGGIFVSAGALGIGLGRIIPSFGYEICGMIAAAVLCTFLIMMLLTPVSFQTRTAVNEFGVSARNDQVLICIFLSIVIRSLAGFLMPLHEMSGSSGIVLAAGMAFLGKLAGGCLADRFGSYRTAVYSQILCVLMIVSLYLPVSLIFVFLINIPMAVTLAALSDCLPDQTGLAFGIAPLGLFVGYLLRIVLHPDALQSVVICTLLSVCCAYLLSKGISKGSEKGGQRN